ncbi:helix-turn-helix transcriptional regulator [uncultured Parasphingorhabdus sp.]|uniref:helix-turn-helix domain-containing protein n=1 Tax=uncultured Parasphingorhabdus sp. TaxID=2709694 RepID=UPI002AA6222E|nr:helix-turn-helix transcriptional regulator [uncultured Parasphingorhabdus sp.]
MPSLLGTKINEIRRERGLTLDQLAQMAGSSKSYMWEIENKDVARPSAVKLEKIAAALGVTATFLMDASQTQPNEDVQDKAFYRKYQQAHPSVKGKLKQILEILDGEN